MYLASYKCNEKVGLVLNVVRVTGQNQSSAVDADHK